MQPDCDQDGVAQDYYEEGCLSFPDIRGDVSEPIGSAANTRILMGILTSLNAMAARPLRATRSGSPQWNPFTERMKKKVLRKILPEINELRARTAEPGPLKRL